MIYDYERLKKDVVWYSKYLKSGLVGKSELGLDIPYLFIGKMGAPQVVITASIHAREYITTNLVMLLIESLMPRRDKLELGVWFVPMVNVDGVELCQKGLSSVQDEDIREKLLRINSCSEDFSMWKANINGVDLNNNFPAMFGMDDSQCPKPAPQGYIGRYPLSERESFALARFTKRLSPKITISYHTKGEVIYWDFHTRGIDKLDRKKSAKIISKSTGYPLISNGNSVGGYKDWCIQTLGIESYTIEVGDDNLSHPLGAEALPDIYRQNKNIVWDLHEILGV